MKRKNQTKGQSIRWSIVIALIAGGIVTGIVIGRAWTGMGEKTPALVEKREGGYKFINPLLECEGAEDIIGDREIKPFKRKLEAYIDEAVHKKRASDIAVYFRDITNGPAFGVNEDDRFAPASLMKVPLMIAYFKMSESQPSLLKQQFLYDGKQDLNSMENFKPSHAIEPGKWYSVEKLIEMMIVYSDNNAMAILDSHINRDFELKVYQELGIVDSTMTGQNKDDFMSLEEYTACFRILFNSSYLNRELSERALRYLAAPDFPDGIMGGVPHGIPVAQKYGERAFLGNNVKELHDCGIVYYPNMPYLLCIMTKGTDFGSLTETIRSISTMVFTEVDGHQRQQQKTESKQN
jgi:beta-lactamase class A